MALKKKDESGQTVEAQGDAQTSGAAEKPVASNVVSKNAFASLISSYANNAADADTDNYLQALRKSLEDPSNKVRVQMKKLTSPPGTVAFIGSKAGIVLVFTSVCEISVNDIKSSRKIQEAAVSFKNQYPNYRLLNVITVSKIDYSKYTQMSEHIANCLQMSEDTGLDNLNVNMLSKYQIVVDIDHSTVKENIDRRSPHGVPGRCDFGFMVGAAAMKDGFAGQVHEAEIMKLISVAGYVEFIETVDPINTMMPKFIPAVHISDIMGFIPSSKLLSLALPMAAEVFITNRLWMQPYLNLRKGEPHPGNLIIDPKSGKPWTAQKQQELDSFFKQYTFPPVLVLDIIEGRARIPGIERFLFDGSYAEIYAEFESFMDSGEIFRRDMPLGQMKYTEIVGNVKADVPGGYMDSRTLDYLYLIATSGYDHKFNDLKYRYEDPHRRVDLIQQFAAFEKTNLMAALQLNSEVVKISGNILSKKLAFWNPSQVSIPMASWNIGDMGNFSSFSMMGSNIRMQGPSPKNIYG